MSDMSMPETNQAAKPRPQSFFQFKLRSLFMLTLIVALLSGFIRIAPPQLWFLIVFPTTPVVGLTTCILGAIYLRGSGRAFWIGFGITLVQALLVGLFFSRFGWRGSILRDEWVAVLFGSFFLLLVPVGTGLLGMYFYRLGNRG